MTDNEKKYQELKELIETIDERRQNENQAIIFYLRKAIHHLEALDRTFADLSKEEEFEKVNEAAIKALRWVDEDDKRAKHIINILEKVKEQLETNNREKDEQKKKKKKQNLTNMVNDLEILKYNLEKLKEETGKVFQELKSERQKTIGEEIVVYANPLLFLVIIFILLVKKRKK
jgi:hypothetical protein